MWLHRVLVVAWGTFHGDTWTLLVFTRGLICSTASGTLVPQPGMEPPPPALQGRLLTTGPPKKSLIMTFRSLGKELRKMLSWVDVEETIHHTFLTSGAASTYLGFCGSQHNTAVLCVKNKGHPKGVILDSKPDQTDMSRNSLKFKPNTKQFVSFQIGASQVILVSI